MTFAGGTATTFNGGFTNNGTFAAGTTTTFNGGFTNNGTFAPGANTVTFSGTGQQIAGATNPTTFNNLTINPGAGDVVTLAQNITVAGNLTVSSGTLDLGAFTANRATSGRDAHRRIRRDAQDRWRQQLPDQLHDQHAHGNRRIQRGHADHRVGCDATETSW